MKTKIFILVISFFTFITAAKAQSFDCNSFCVQDIRLDTADPDILLATIYFSGEENSFINYPYVSAIVDQHGDTLGTGTLNFFGQIGNTSLDYPLTSRVDSIPEELEAFLFFHYDTISCVLSFPCLVSSTKDYDLSDVKVYPNPASSTITITTSHHFLDATLIFYDLKGQIVRKGYHLSGESLSFNLDKFAQGVYFLKVIDHHKLIGMSKVIIN